LCLGVGIGDFLLVVWCLRGEVWCVGFLLFVLIVLWFVVEVYFSWRVDGKLDRLLRCLSRVWIVLVLGLLGVCVVGLGIGFFGLVGWGVVVCGLSGICGGGVVGCG